MENLLIGGLLVVLYIKCELVILLFIKKTEINYFIKLKIDIQNIQ